MKDDLYITELHGRRFEVALELLQEGRPFIYEGITFHLTGSDELECGVQFTGPLDDEGARRDLNRARNILKQMMDTTPEFAEIIDNRKIQFCLIDDYAIGRVTLCRFDGDDIMWSAGLPPT
jgi:hypothetical protein